MDGTDAQPRLPARGRRMQVAPASRSRPMAVFRTPRAPGRARRCGRGGGLRRTSHRVPGAIRSRSPSARGPEPAAARRPHARASGSSRHRPVRPLGRRCRIRPCAAGEDRPDAREAPVAVEREPFARQRDQGTEPGPHGTLESRHIERAEHSTERRPTGRAVPLGSQPAQPLRRLARGPFRDRDQAAGRIPGIPHGCVKIVS
jgi:hypothetical protein